MRALRRTVPDPVSPPNNARFNQFVALRIAPFGGRKAARERQKISAVVILAKQFHGHARLGRCRDLKLGKTFFAGDHEIRTCWEKRRAPASP